MSKHAAHESENVEPRTSDRVLPSDAKSEVETSDLSLQPEGRDSDGSGRLNRLAVGVPGNRLVFVLAIVALITAIAVVSWMAHSQRVEDDRAAEAQKEVGTSLVRLLSWTPRSVLSELDDEKGLLTGDFADDYAELVQDTIGPAARKSGLSSTAEIRASGVISQDGDKTELLYFVNVTVTGKGQKDEVVGSRIRVTAVERDGTWLIEKYDPI